MDRFIVIADVADDESVLHLKSNMDRFIVLANYNTEKGTTYLKSNMDRFIADILAITKSRIEKFKIQYG